MSIDRTQAFVLRKMDFRETSLIVDFFSRDFGKVSGLLKGIRKDSRKFASSVEPFSLNEIIFYRKRNSSLHLISQCDENENFASIRSDIPKISSASFMMDMVNSVMPQEDKNEEVFNLIRDSLVELKTSSNPEKISLIFKIKMLSLSGFKPHFDSCVSCQDPINAESRFSLSMGGLLCPRCAKKDPSGRIIFRGTIATIIYIERNAFCTNLNLGLNPQVKRELELILNSFIHFHLEKELKSIRITNQLKADLAAV